ncbi:MAG: hypothetical protein U5K00_00390 [Melioribacteraceae bacterium]|nr:hypothetical protein [Melioribacteraceae bacterium]
MTLRYKEIKEKIQNKFDALPKNQKKIAEFILEDFDKVSFLNLENISEATGTSVASVVRFCQKSGIFGV